VAGQSLTNQLYWGAGSQEERWQLQIVAKGRVPCPKCKSVSRKTVDGLKKHMESCRLVGIGRGTNMCAIIFIIF